jgi:uncharacterized protein YkwD
MDFRIRTWISLLMIFPALLATACARPEPASKSSSASSARTSYPVPTPKSGVRTATYREKSSSLGNLGADIINIVNEYRRGKGLPSLRMLNIANTEASLHSQEMANKKVGFGHTGFNQRALVISRQLNGTSATGENVAYGKMTAHEVVAAWLRSPAHRQNIEGTFNYTGVGVARDSQGLLYYTQLFIKK